jgi:two-component system, NarL family, sensor histidine kinase DevS
VARELTDPRYAAINVLGQRRETLERFLTDGIDDETHRQIGGRPGERGVLISDAQSLRLRTSTPTRGLTASRSRIPR